MATNREEPDGPPARTLHSLFDDSARKLLQEARDTDAALAVVALYLHGSGPSPRLVSWVAEYGDNVGVEFMVRLQAECTPHLQPGEHLELREGTTNGPHDVD